MSRCRTSIASDAASWAAPPHRYAATTSKKDGSDAFNRRFIVNTNDHRGAVALLTSDTQARLLELDSQHLRASAARVYVDAKPSLRGSR